MQMQVLTLTFKYALLKRKIEVQFFFLSKIQINPNQIISNYFFHSYSKQTNLFDAIWKEKWHRFKRKDATTFSHKTFNSLTKRKTNLEKKNGSFVIMRRKNTRRNTQWTLEILSH